MLLVQWMGILFKLRNVSYIRSIIHCNTEKQLLQKVRVLHVDNLGQKITLPSTFVL